MVAAVQIPRMRLHIKTKKNPHGSVDIYFTPQPPLGRGDNWVTTAKGGQWFGIFPLLRSREGILRQELEAAAYRANGVRGRRKLRGDVVISEQNHDQSN